MGSQDRGGAEGVCAGPGTLCPQQEATEGTAHRVAETLSHSEVLGARDPWISGGFYCGRN